MKRRDFLIGSAATAAATRWSAAQDAPVMAKLDRVGMMSGNFEPLLKEVRDWSQPASPGTLDIMDFPAMLAERYQVHNVEVQQIHFLSMEPAYYEKFLGRLQKARSKMINMPLELDKSGYSGTISPCSPDPQIRAHAIELSKKWIDIAAIIECPSVMLNQGKNFGDNPAAAVEGLKILKDYGESKKVAILLEERGRATSIETLVKVIKDAGIYANPDMGNWPDEESMEHGLRLMYPLALTVSHVKYNPERFSLSKAVAISKEMNFKGVYSLETGGAEPYAMAQTLLDRLLTYM